MGIFSDKGKNSIWVNKKSNAYVLNHLDTIGIFSNIRKNSISCPKILPRVSVIFNSIGNQSDDISATLDSTGENIMIFPISSGMIWIFFLSHRKDRNCSENFPNLHRKILDFTMDFLRYGSFSESVHAFLLYQASETFGIGKKIRAWLVGYINEFMHQ